MAAAPLLVPKPDPDAPPLTDDHSDFAHRLSQQRLDAISPTPPPPPSANPARASSSTATADTKGKKRARGTPGAGMVCATVTSANLLQVRAQLRAARLTFEALRRRYHRESHKQPHLRALRTMNSRGLSLYRDLHILGPVPGVFVGDVFNYRAELCVVGLHNQPHGGIGYAPARLVSEGHPVATSIISSGGYLDEDDKGDVLVYTGSGGRPNANLALGNSFKFNVEVRVVRCQNCDASPRGKKLYVYDGLYKVKSFTSSPGKSGHQVFTLERLPGQEPLGSSISSRERVRVPDMLSPPGGGTGPSNTRPHRTRRPNSRVVGPTWTK